MCLASDQSELHCSQFVWPQMLLSEEVSSLRYIADGVAPFIPGGQVAQLLVAHSPDHQQYKQYMKPRGHLPVPLYMPFWELHELEAVRQRFYPNISHDQVWVEAKRLYSVVCCATLPSLP